MQTDPARRAIFRFDPTVSTGTLLQLGGLILVACGAWATYQSDRATTRLELEQVKSAAVAEKAANRESLVELKSDVKEIQRSLIEVNKTLAVIESKQQPKGKP